MRIQLTGAAGVIGRALCRGLVARGHEVLGAIRTAAAPIPGVTMCPVGEIGPETRWAGRLDGVEAVVHLANRAHRRQTTSPLDEPAAAAALARAAAETGVRRVVYLSSVRALGEATPKGMPFRADDPPRPRDPYGRGKLACERALQGALESGGPELVVLRPPLVYGPGVRANFRALIGLAATPVPLPFAGIDNRRSLIFIDNLVDLLALGCTHPAAAGRVMLACDGQDFSTPELLRLLAEGLGRRARLFAVPSAPWPLLRAVPRLGPLFARLSQSLQVDDGATRAALGWAPPHAPEPALIATARAFARR